MTQIILHTTINAPIEKVFNLSRDIDFHIRSASQTQERAIDGRASGRIEMGEEVHWKGKHFGLWLQHRSKITHFEFPYSFTDEMIKGHFKYFKHEHRFRESGNKTIMEDILTYSTPYGYLGKLFDFLILKKHLTRFLKSRNQILKYSADC